MNSSIAAVEIGGRSWHIAADAMTEAQEAFIHERADACGLFTFDPTTETVDMFFRRVMQRNRAKPQPLYEIFAAVHLPAGINNAQWTPKLSKQNALFFVALTNPTDVQFMTLGFLGIFRDAVEIRTARTKPN